MWLRATDINTMQVMKRFFELLFVCAVTVMFVNGQDVEVEMMETIEEGVAGNAAEFEYPLMSYAREGNLEALREELHVNNADVNYQNNVGWTSLTYAVEMARWDIFNEVRSSE